MFAGFYAINYTIMRMKKDSTIAHTLNLLLYKSLNIYFYYLIENFITHKMAKYKLWFKYQILYIYTYNNSIANYANLFKIKNNDILLHMYRVVNYQRKNLLLSNNKIKHTFKLQKEKAYF